MTTIDSTQPQHSADDADPMVDALLAEFVSSDPDRRRRPPDLTAKIIAQLASSSEGSPNEEIDQESYADTDDVDPVVDTLLTEILPSDVERKKTPPDLRDPILLQLDHTAAPQRGLAESGLSKTTSQAVPSEQVNNQLSMPRLVSVVVAVAASVIGIAYLGGITSKNQDPANKPSDGQIAVASPGSAIGAQRPGLSSNEGEISANSPMIAAEDAPSETDVPIQGIPLDQPTGQMADHSEAAIAMASDVDAVDPQDPKTELSPSKTVKSVPIAEVAALTSRSAQRYWQNLQVTPTPQIDPSALAERLKRTLGVDVSSQALADPQRLRDQLTRDNNARQIAKRWLSLATGASIATLDQGDNRPLVGHLSKSVSGQQPFDTTLVSLIDGSSEQSAQWYESMARGGHESIALRLANVTMDADLRCVRCHDSRIGRSGTQDDYWSFVAFARNAIQRKDDRWIVQENSAGQPKFQFYELPDGRQHAAAPRVSPLLAGSAEEILEFGQWAQGLGGSETLAKSLVDSIWQLVHGRRLSPSPVDASAPPADENLESLHQQLADDLIANRFDVARTLALVIDSPMSRRSTPNALQSKSALTATDQQRSDALEVVAAFAGWVETPAAARRVRIDVAMKRIGNRLDTGGNTLLAQPLLQNGGGPSAKTPAPPVIGLAEQLAVDFPGQDSHLPVAWLRSIKDFDQQVQHLVFLSGGKEVPQDIKDVARDLKDFGTVESALSRVWWILKK